MLKIKCRLGSAGICQGLKDFNMNRYGRSLASGCLAALAGLTLLSAQVQAQSYPTRSITMIVPFAAGGPTDVIARIEGRQ